MTRGAVVRAEDRHVLVVRHGDGQLALVDVEQADGADTLGRYAAELARALLQVRVVLVQGARVLRNVVDRNAADAQHHPAKHTHRKGLVISGYRAIIREVFYFISFRKSPTGLPIKRRSQCLKFALGFGKKPPVACHASR